MSTVQQVFADKYFKI